MISSYHLVANRVWQHLKYWKKHRRLLVQSLLYRQQNDMRTRRMMKIQLKNSQQRELERCQQSRGERGNSSSICSFVSVHIRMKIRTSKQYIYYQGITTNVSQNMKDDTAEEVEGRFKSVVYMVSGCLKDAHILPPRLIIKWIHSFKF